MAFSIKSVPKHKIVFAAGVLAIVGFFFVRRYLAPTDAAQVEKRLRAVARAVKNKDRDTLFGALAPDFTLEDERGHVFTLDEVTYRHDHFVRHYLIRSIRFGQVKTDVRENGPALVHFRTTARYFIPGAGAGTHRGEWLAEFVRRNGEWKLKSFKILGEGMYL